jgi:hypothetical protein
MQLPQRLMQESYCRMLSKTYEPQIPKATMVGPRRQKGAHDKYVPFVQWDSCGMSTDPLALDARGTAVWLPVVIFWRGWRLQIALPQTDFFLEVASGRKRHPRSAEVQHFVCKSQSYRRTQFRSSRGPPTTSSYTLQSRTPCRKTCGVARRDQRTKGCHPRKR